MSMFLTYWHMCITEGELREAYLYLVVVVNIIVIRLGK